MFTVHPNSSNASGNVFEIDDVLHDKYVLYSRICLMSGSLILIALGIPGNLLTITVLYGRWLKDRSLHFYLSSLCSFNVVTILLRVPRFLLEYVIGKDVADFRPTPCAIIKWLDLTLVSITTWHVTSITLFRLIYLLCRFEPETIKKMIIRFAAASLMLDVGYNIYAFAFDRPRNFKSSRCHMVTITWMCFVCSLSNAALVRNGLVIFTRTNATTWCEFNTTTWMFWFEATFSSFLPVALLFFCYAFLLIFSLYLRSQKANFFLAARGLGKRLVPLVLMSTVLLVVTTVPIKIVEYFKENIFANRSEANLYLNIARMLLFANNAVNYFPYCVLEKRLGSHIRLVVSTLCDCCIWCMDKASSPALELRIRSQRESRQTSPDSFALK